MNEFPISREALHSKGSLHVEAQTLHQRYEVQAVQTPTRPAVVFEQQVLTYADLNVRASRIAAHLTAAGVGPEVRVGLYAERSLALVVGLLGILKSGGAYVPLDPAYPETRLRFMLDDTAAPIVVAQRSLSSGLPVESARSVLEVEEDGTISSPIEAVPMRPGHGGQLAYVIYTSGSSGQPKGVLIEHRSVLNYVDGVWERLGLEPAAQYAMVQPLTVDSCVTMLYPALLSGGCLHIVSQTRAADPQALGAYMQQHRIDALKIAPSHLDALVQAAARPAMLFPRRWLIVGGEASQCERVARWQALAPSCAVFNHYGPTEATVGVTAYRVDRQAPSDEGFVPIGRPLAGSYAYVLDEAGERVADGEVGELYVGGACLARGYLNRPALTAERFVADPFNTASDARLYRTGDLVRKRSDGNLVFLGRIDDQVKVNGYRIEPGEVEAVLSRHPGVRQSVVHAAEDSTGGNQLVAYIVAEGTEAPSVAGLRSFLQERLPPHLVPSAFVALEALPRTTHGKLDRKALPRPTFSTDVAVGEAPQTPVEDIVAAAWTEVLGGGPVGRHDDFFDLGGHSLLAIRILGRLRTQTGTTLSLPDLFETPTVAGLADTIARRGGAVGQGGSREGMGAMAARPRANAEAPLSPAQQRLWFLAQLQPQSPLYNMVKGFMLHGPLDERALQHALNGVVERQEILRSRYVSDAGEPRQIIDPSGEVEMRRVDLQDMPEQAQDAALGEVLRTESRRPFDLARDRVIRALLVRCAPEKHALLLVIHHIAFDGLSQPILLRELAELYASTASSAGPVSPLEPLPVQYADYAAWHREAMETPRVEAQVTFWKRKLADLPVLTLPPEGGRPPQQTFNGAEQALPIPAPVVEPLRRLSREEGVSLFMTLLAVFDVLIGYYTGAEDVPVGATVAGRGEVETEGMIGFFANMVVMRADLSGDPSFRDMLRRVRLMALEAYAHQDAPFDRVVEAVQQKRDPRYSPLVQIVFALQDAAAMDLRLPGISTTPLAVDNGTAKYDLVFDVIMDGETPVTGLLEYNTDLYTERTARRFLWHYNMLLHLATTQPDMRLSALKRILNEQEAAERQAATTRVSAANLEKLQALRTRPRH